VQDLIQTDDSDSALVKPGRQVLLAVAFGAFLTSFDASGVNAILPLIRSAFATTISSAQWVVGIELLIAGSLQLAIGRLGDRLGHRSLYLTGFCIFVCGCAASGFAGTLRALILCRSIHGVGTAILLANSAAVLVTHAPAGQRGWFFGVKSSCIYSGLIAGPALSVWVGGKWGWRAVFWTELPAALVGLALAAWLIPRNDRFARFNRYDLAGACVWTCGLSSCFWLLWRNRPAFHWEGTLPYATAVFVVLFIAAAAVERRRPGAVLDRSCYSRALAAPAVSLLAAFAASQILTFALPFLLAERFRQSSMAIGGLLALNALARSMVAFFSGRWSDRTDGRLLAAGGLFVFALGLALLLDAANHGSFSEAAAAIFIAGLGFGCFVPPNNSLLMGSVPRARYGLAAGILATSRSIGMAGGVALAAALLTSGRSLGQRAGLAYIASTVLAAVAATSVLAAHTSPRPGLRRSV
jgi:MFS family permease